MHRREREAAVAADDARDAVDVARRRRRVPEELRVVVGVRVDEARGDDEPVGVDRPRRVARRPPRPRRSGRPGSRRRRACRRAGAVHDRPAADHDVEHGVVPLLAAGAPNLTGRQITRALQGGPDPLRSRGG